MRARVASGVRGWAMVEYLAVLVGLMAIWRGSQLVLGLLADYRAAYEWVTSLPF